MIFSPKNFKSYYHTVKHLKIKQIYFRLFYLTTRRIGLLRYAETMKSSSAVYLPTTCEFIFTPKSRSDLTFNFLNQSHTFHKDVDWDFSSFGLLWTYNLNYFDFINQANAETASSLHLMKAFANKVPTLKIGCAPYPTSLRIMNWIKFLLSHKVQDETITVSLLNQISWLARNLEYHLLGNHLLENGFALLQASAMFPSAGTSVLAKQTVVSQLKEQILPDGAHYELSPMYHQILLGRLLDTINILQAYNVHTDVLTNLRGYASKMLGWLLQITFSDGSIPLVNDAAFGIAPTTCQLADYAGRLGIHSLPTQLSSSGYRKIVTKKYELLVDVGDIGPDYIPGHAHSDTLSFLLYVDGRPVIVDTGTSTYESGSLRSYQRSTAAHNTVQLAGMDQSEMWASFRVAQRAKIRDLNTTEGSISAWHDGYQRIECRHHRTFFYDDESISITDIVDSSGHYKTTKAFLHFHPDIQVKVTGDSISTKELNVKFDNAVAIKTVNFSYAPQFNITQTATCLEIIFEKRLATHISFR